MRHSLWLVVLLSVLSAGCGPLVDLGQNLEIMDVKTGWADIGIINGQNKLVPQVSFKLKNLSQENLVALQINAVFRREGFPNDEWGAGYLLISQSEGLGPGVTTKEWTITSNLGYTGLEPRSDMLKNAQFVDARVELAAKYASAQWKRVANYPIDRHLLTN